MCINTYVYMYMYMHMHMHAYVYVCMCMCVHTSTSATVPRVAMGRGRMPRAAWQGFCNLLLPPPSLAHAWPHARALLLMGGSVDGRISAGSHSGSLGLSKASSRPGKAIETRKMAQDAAKRAQYSSRIAQHCLTTAQGGLQTFQKGLQYVAP